MDFNGILGELQWLWSILGSIGIGTIIAFLGVLINRRTTKQLKETVRDFISKITSVELPNSVTVDLTAIAKSELASLKIDLETIHGGEINRLKQLIEAIVETLATSRSTSIDRSQALMTLINKPAPKKQVIRIEKKPELFKSKSEQKEKPDYVNFEGVQNEVD